MTVSIKEICERSQKMDLTVYKEFQVNSELFDKITQYKKFGLERQVDRLVFEERCKHVDKYFQSNTILEMMYMLTGKNSWHIKSMKDRWANDALLVRITRYLGFGKNNHFLMNHIRRLKVDIPYGVVLRLNELNDAKIFDEFRAIAPFECFTHPTNQDPIVVGVIKKWPNRFVDFMQKSDLEENESKLYLIAQW